MSGLFGGAQKATSSPTEAMGIDFQGAQYGNVVPVVYGQNKVSGNCIWYGDFKATAQQQKSGKGGGGGGTTNYTYSASAQMGLCEGPGISLVTVYNGTSVVNLSSINYAFASGAKGQAAWSHLSGSYALGYSLTAVFSFQNLALGSSASLPNYNYVVNALKPYGSGIVDANPADILSDICSDPYHGINFPWLGSLTQYSNYCVANSLFLSPVYDQQQSAQESLSDLFKYTNAYAYYSDDQLKVVPLGDVAVTGNGVTYTPNVTPLVNLDDTDFLVNGEGDVPVQVTRQAPQDSMNVVRVEFTDRSNTYHDSAVVASIDFDVVANGERSDTSETVNGCTTAAVARFIGQNLVQRAFYVRNTYQFKLPWNYCYLEPCDIVTITDASLGLNLFPVRITSVEEDGESTLTIEAEEFPEGIGHSAVYGTQANGGTNTDQNADPGAVNAPYLFRGPGFLVGNNTPEIWCACNGSGSMWGAAEVYLSHDGTSYTYCGTIASQARYGVTTTSLPIGSADPDTTNTPSVQLYAPAQLLGGSQADADNFVTLAMVDTEVIAYETATLTGANTYQLAYLRRGGYGSTNAAHSSGAPFVRLDDSIFRIPVDPSLIGQTVYLKFLSLNVFGRTPRTLAGETAYTYVVGTNVELPDVPDVPASFAVLPVADGVNITWSNDNPAATGCTSIEYATASIGPWTVLAQAGPTTTFFTHHFTTGATYYYRAKARGPLPQSGWSAYTSTLNSQGKIVSLNSNLFNNPSGALGTSGWNGIGGGGSGFTTLDASDGWQFRFNPVASSSTIGETSPVTFITPGDYTVSADFYFAGLSSGHAVCDVQVTDSSNTVLSTTTILSAATGAGWARYSGTLTAPSGAARLYVRFYLQSGTSSTVTAWRRVKVESGDSATAFTDDATQNGNLLTAAGSGQQIGDQRNLPPVNTAGGGAILTSSPLSFSISGTTVTFNCAAVGVQFGGPTVNYNAATPITKTQTAGTTQVWNLYYVDPTYSGGTQTLHASTSVADLVSSAGVVNLGSCSVTVASGGGGSGGTGGGGGRCVADDMFIGKGRTAGNAEIGDPFDCIDLPTQAGKHVRALQGVTRGVEECVRMVTSDGCALVCSISTPFDLPDGRNATSLHMLGEQVITDLGTATVTSLALVGPLPVTRAHLGGVSYAAGADPQRRIYSHNFSGKP